jgi:2-aminoethylphosphonate dioxygenase
MNPGDTGFHQPGGFTGTMAENFAKTGLHVEYGLFSNRADDLKQWANEIAALPPDKVWHYYEKAPGSGDDMLSRTEKFIGVHKGAGELINSMKLSARLAELFGESAVLFKDKLNYKLHGNAGFEAHQDVQAGWQQYTKEFISVGIAIDDQLAAGGCLEFVRNNYGREMIGELWKPLSESSVDPALFEAMPMRSGDVAFFDGWVPHRSLPNRVSDSQRIFYLTFNRRSAGDFREQYYADKFKSFPPDFYRDDGKTYAYKV